MENGEWRMKDDSQFSTLHSPLDELFVLNRWLELADKEADLKRQIRAAEAALDRLAYDQYPQLSVAEIKTLVVDDKWLTAVAAGVQGELERVSQTLTGRIRQLAERYAVPLPQLVDEVAELSARVDEHLKRMGFGVNGELRMESGE
jgi:type I restriction enzyme M protein